MAFFPAKARRAKAGQKAGFRVMLKYFEINKAFRYYIKQIDSKLPSSSETQGQLVGARKSPSGRGKNSGEEKSRTTRRAPGDKVLTDQFQTAGVVLASDWFHKTFIFFVPNHRAARLGVVSRLLTL